MNKEFNGFDEMVEALEENEDMVECKECFELFPKIDCERSDIGYICPVCRGLRTPVAQAKFEDPYDCYTQDFPDVQEYDPGTMKDYEEEPSLGDALSDLIEDEYEAIEGYEAADETVQHAAIDGDTKDEILDTLDHIKEEEEEHIDELKELCPECDPEAEPKAEPEKLEEATDDEAADEEPEAEEIPEEGTEDPEENENEEVSDLETAYEAALEVANEKGVGQVFGYASVDDEAFVAIEPFDVDDAEAVEDDLRAVYEDVKYAYVAYPEKSLEEALFEDVELNEGPGRWLKGVGQKIGNAVKHLSNKDSGKLIDNFFNEGYVLIFEGPKENGKLPEEHKEEYDTADQALTAALHLSKEYPKHKIWVFAKPIDESELTPREKKLAAAKNGLGAVIGCFRNGTALQKKDKELADTLKKIEIDKQDLMKTTGKTAGEKRGDPRDSMGEEEPEETSEETEDEDPNLDDDEEVVDPKEKAKQALGEKKVADGYTPESYKRYEAAYNKIVAWIEAHTKPEALTPERIDGLRKQAEAKLVENPDEDPNLDDDEDTPEETTDTGEAVDETGDTDTEEHSEETASEDEVPETEDEAEEPEEEPTTDSTDEPVEKLSEVSEEQLKKLYTAVTGQGVGDNKKWQKVLARMRAKLQELGESLDPQDYKAEDFIEEELSSEAEAIKSLKDTQATLKSAADGIKNMTSAMIESVLNLSPADFAECTDSSRVELWGLEEAEDGVAEAVLIKSYDDVSDEDIQSCHDEMLKLDGMFTFYFTKSGKPAIYGWNAEQLRELTQAGVKGISFDNPAYEEALSLAWRIK